MDQETARHAYYWSASEFMNGFLNSLISSPFSDCIIERILGLKARMVQVSCLSTCAGYIVVYESHD